MNNENEITIILADDHELLRDGFTTCFEQPGIRVLAVAKNGDELVQLVRELRPQVVVTDIRMPIMDGIAATAIIKKEFPATKVLPLSGFDEIGLIEEMRAAGADGFASKSAGNEELLSAVVALSRGREFYCSETAKRLLSLQIEPPPPGIHLTPKEVEVMKLVSRGMSNKEIAAALRIKTRTVETHRARLYQKTATRSPVQLALFCRRWTAHEGKELEGCVA
jgi:DNA-binding NarL/FixJ family response regulator